MGEKGGGEVGQKWFFLTFFFFFLPPILTLQFLRVPAYIIHLFMTLVRITLIFTLWLHIHNKQSNHTPAVATTPDARSPPPTPSTSGAIRSTKTLLPLRSSRPTSASTASCPFILFCCW